MRYEFPKDFLWGVATSAYQIEGAVDEDGRGKSIWDVFSHTPGKIHNDENGDVACDHYHRYKEDVESMAELGVKAYRFSISWCRIFPDGKKNLNEKGLDFYSKLVDELLKHEIEPFPTLYHWDLPQALQENGGWENRETVNWFEKYSYTVFKRLGDRVKNWITLNEPFCSSFLGYVTGEHAPGYRNEVKRALSVAHNLLLAHGKSVKILREEVRGGRIGIANAVNIVSPASENEDDIRSARMVDEILNGWYHEPIASGKYPDELSKMYEF
ncbi:MAG TPA: glycosyl hydrolase family protein, partial [Thermotogales bacterium]|nr:glycosyl hydrolase family protein [Thermotogales bacterium]